MPALSVLQDISVFVTFDTNPPLYQLGVMIGPANQDTPFQLDVENSE
jgi:hypothetical protein